MQKLKQIKETSQVAQSRCALQSSAGPHSFIYHHMGHGVLGSQYTRNNSGFASNDGSNGRPFLKS